MTNKKDNLIIFVLCLIVISLGVLIVIKNPAGIKIAKNTNINLNQNQNINQAVNQNINQNINTNQKPKDEYKGELIKEADGWKKYRNEYWGIEFRFRDEEDEIDKVDFNDGMTFGKRGNIQSEPYIYIGFFKKILINNKKYDVLKEYLEVDSKIIYGEPDELISVKEVINNNNLKFIEVIANISFGRKVPGEYYMIKNYYIEYSKQQEINKDFIEISYVRFNTPIDVVDTFKFID